MIGATAIKSALAPYLLWIALAAAAAIAGVAFYQGHKVGTNAQIVASQKQVDALNASIAGKNTSLRDAAVALRAASNAIKAINREAGRRRAEAAAAELAKQGATRLANQYAEQLRRGRAGFEAELARARGKPSCAALLDFDVNAELARAGCPASLVNGGVR